MQEKVVRSPAPEGHIMLFFHHRLIEDRVFLTVEHQINPCLFGLLLEQIAELARCG